LLLSTLTMSVPSDPTHVPGSASPTPAPGPVLVTGATGFVGRHLMVALEEMGRSIRAASRDPVEARREEPARRRTEWVELDTERPETLRPALQGCSAAVYLVHSISGDDDYVERELRSARAFLEAAEAAEVGRIVYLGGVKPQGEPSRHLASRLGTGEILRSGGLPVFELRASMIIGRGSDSWTMVRDLAARLPAMVMPQWMENRSCPVAIRDVVVALARCLDLPPTEAGWYDIPGPEALTHRDLVERVASWKGNRPVVVEVPFVTPKLSTYWIDLVTDVVSDLAAELVEGLLHDLLPGGRPLWKLVDHHPLDLAEAIDHAFRDEETDAPPPTPRMEAGIRQALT
jgi:uncharacterized protein YbjT (DUF2867 family)